MTYRRKKVRVRAGAGAVIRINGSAEPTEIFTAAKSKATRNHFRLSLLRREKYKGVFDVRPIQGKIEHLIFCLKSISCDCLFNGGNEGVPEGKGCGEKGETHQETHRVPRHSLVVPAHSDSCSYRILPLVRYLPVPPLYRLPKSETFQSAFRIRIPLGQRIQISNSDPDPARPKFKLSPKRENIYDGF